MKPNVIVIGLGQYYQKIRKGISRYFNIIRLIDIKPIRELKLTKSEASKFLYISKNNDVFIDKSVDCVMILTPPASHFEYLDLLWAYQKDILIEKPLLITSADVHKVQSIIVDFPKLYCSDFYLDVRATPLFSWFYPKKYLPLQKEIVRIKGNKKFWDDGPQSFGKILRIEGKLLEGYGEARGFEGREWLWDSNQGGVLLDLMYHYFTLTSFLFDEKIDISESVLKTLANKNSLIDWRPSLGKSETMAHVTGKVGAAIPFTFDVAKYWGNCNARTFRIFFKLGTATMEFKKQNILLLNHKKGKCVVKLDGNYYDHISKCFYDFVLMPEKKPHGMKHAFRAIRMIENIKRMF